MIEVFIKLFIISVFLYFIFLTIYFVRITFSIKGLKVLTPVHIEPCELNTVSSINHELLEQLSAIFLKNGFEFDREYKEMSEKSSEAYLRRFVNKDYSSVSIIEFAFNHVQKEINGKKIAIQSSGCIFEITTRFTDGTKVLSTPRSYPGIFKHDNTTAFICNSINEIEEMLVKHFYKVREYSKSKDIDDSVLTKDIEVLSNENLKEFSEIQVKHRLISYDSPNSCYRYTWKGALKAASHHLHFRLLTSQKLKKEGNPFAVRTSGANPYFSFKSYIFACTTLASLLLLTSGTLTSDQNSAMLTVFIASCIFWYILLSLAKLSSQKAESSNRLT
ncbi:MAG TPA: hypothetical protein VHT34_05410, partial [Clostridia bacterium]|nr:hypothetical protein [Clostridia bacterium]